MHSYSVKLIINQQRIKPEGLCALYLRVIINRVECRVKLGISWPLKFIDQANGRILPQSRKDKDFRDYEMIILSELGKVNEIFKIYRLRDNLLLTADLFKKELKNFTRRKDFLVFMKEDIEERYAERSIVFNTYRNHKTTYNRLLKFAAVIPFYSLDSKFLNRFTNWLKTDCDNDISTLWGRVKDIITYLGRAEAEGIGVNADYHNYKNQEGGGRIVFLEHAQLKKLTDLHRKKTLGETHQTTLTAFLFACFTSLRISDVRRANWGWVNIRSEMAFLPWKGRRFGRMLTVPLSDLAKKYIDKPKGAFFNLPTDQEMNRSLKDIAKEAEVDLHLTFHVARHTFATLYYRQTQNIMTLKEILGHRKIENTLVYAHINEKDKKNSMDHFQEEMMKLLS